MGLLLEGGRANAQIEKDNRHMFLIFLCCAEWVYYLEGGRNTQGTKKLF
jgi:hypothetical protein